MIASLKSEARKLLSIRSTYVILIICLALEFIFAFFVVGWHTQPAELANPHYLTSQMLSAVNALSLLFAVISVLAVTHEYRYNTILYTLTNTKSRSRALLAKFVVVSIFILIASLLFGLLSLILSEAAIHLRHLSLAHQDVQVWSTLWRSMFAGWGFAALAFVMAVIIRVQVGALVVLFIIPSTVEGLIGVLLKNNRVYLPFNALNILLDGGENTVHIPYVRAAFVAGVYIIVGWLVGWYLFLKRDVG